ncbi:MAG: protein BatD [Bacteroidetes bacterium]|nr:protein BatD [Bacteroidota bacterium]
MVKKGIYILLFLLIALVVTKPLFAQSFTASVSSKQISQHQNINVTFKVSGNFQRITDLQFPTFTGFQVLSQPQQYQSTTEINGVAIHEYQFTIALKPTSVGKLTIDPASVKIDGKTLKTKSISIQVSKENMGSNSATQGSPQGSDKSVFTSTLVSQSKIYKGQAISVTQKVYSRKEIIDISDYKLPTYEGFLVENIDIGQLRVENEVLDGIQYFVIVLEKKVLFAQKTGRIKLEAPTMKLDIKEVKTRDARNQAEYMFYGPKIRYAEKVRAKVYSSPVYIQVSSLPTAPAEYEDLTGSFTFQVSTDKTATKINDPITLTIKVQGTGNLHMLTDFNLDLPDDIETYEPKIKQNLSLTSNGFKGFKSFEYLLVPRKAGTFTLPSIKFVYFDVQSAQYKNLENEQIKIKVEKGEGNYAGDLPTGLSKKEIELRGKDIHFIQQDLGSYSSIANRFVGSLTFYLFYLIPAIVFLLLLFYYKRFKHLRTNVSLFRQKKASSYSNKKLKTAKKLLQLNDKVGFFEEISNAVYGYLGDKLMLSSAELSREKVNEIFFERSVDKELVTNLFQLLDACEFARFAPDSSADNLDSTYQSALALLTKLEKELAK